MRDLDWFDGTEQDQADGRGAPRRRLLLAALAAVPWLVVAALLVVPLGDDAGARATTDTDDASVTATTTGPGSDGGAAQTQDGSSDEPAARGSTATADPAAPTSSPSSPAPTGMEDTTHDGVARDHAGAPVAVLEVEELRGRWRVAPGEEELAALAVIAARAHLTGIGPHLAVEGADPPRDTYAEHLVVEAVEHPSPETAVATVVAVVLLEPADGNARVALRRLVVPLAHGEDGPWIAGRPWELPPPSLPAPDTTALEPVEDPALFTAADTALAVAGLGQRRTTALETAPGWPLVATTSGPDGEQQVWLRRHLDGLVVAGSPLHGAAPTDSTTTSPSTEEERP